MTVDYDLVVLGGGPGGYVAAIRASQLGMKVALVEKNKVGGTCLHNGCIPTKSFLKSAEKYRTLKQYKQFGISGIDLNSISVNFTQVQKRKNKIISQLHNGVQQLLKKANVDIFQGFGRILGPSIFSPLSGTISIEYDDGSENSILSPKYVLIATGSTDRKLEGLQVDGKHVLNVEQTLNLKEIPESVIIIGGGVIGIEFASILCDFGTDVTIVEAQEDILLNEDKEVRDELKRLFKKRGIKFVKNGRINSESLQADHNNVSIDVQIDEELTSLNAEKLLVAVGREPNVKNIGIENTNITFNGPYIKTNEMFQTEERHIYAIGDCIGGMQLAHVASKEGVIAVEHMANNNPLPLDERSVPNAIYAHPEIGRVGLTEQEAIEKNYNINVGKFPFSNIGKSIIDGEPDGFIKIISDKKTDDILGIHMVGTRVTELISNGSLAKVLDATPWEISHTVHPHPTNSEAFMEAALAVNDEQIHG